MANGYNEEFRGGFEVVGVCIECKSDQPNSYMERSPFGEPPCKYCGGVVKVFPKEERRKKNELAKQDRQRGIDHAKSSK